MALSQFYISDVLNELSEAAAGALQAFAEVLNVAQADVRAELHAARAVFMEAENVAQAALTATRNEAVVVLVYACANAVARAE